VLEAQIISVGQMNFLNTEQKYCRKEFIVVDVKDESSVDV